MGPKSDAEDSDTNSRDILNRAIPPTDVTSKPITGGPVARLYCKNRFEYLISKTRVLVGRSGGESRTGGPELDISIDSCSLYISRRHFDIIVRDYNKFFISVFSKNGLFVNGLFLGGGSTEFQIKNQSRIRFPKTDLKILFQLLEKDPQSVRDAPLEMPEVMKTENGEFNYSAQLNSQAQPYSMAHQQMVSLNEPEKVKENVMVAPVAAVPSKLEREVYKHHTPQTGKKRKFRDPEIDAAANNRASQEWGSRGDYGDGRKPPFSYSQLIAQAIFSAPEHMLCLNDIYMFITKTYPFYKPEDKGWQNSIRHNLSLSKSFVRLPRANEEGKGSLWSIEFSDKQNLSKTAYRPRGTRDKYNHPPPPKIPRIVAEPNVGESEDSNEVTYQNEDEEAANNIAMASQVSSEGYGFSSSDHFGDGEDQTFKTPQAAILQSSFANPMQIFMQPDRRGNLNQQHINLSQLQRAGVAGSGSVQVVRLTVNPNNVNETSYGTFEPPAQQELLDMSAGMLDSNQESQVWQPQQIRIQQPAQVSGSGQKIFILRHAQQQQQISSDSAISIAAPATVAQQAQPKKIVLAGSVGGGTITILNPGNALNKGHGQLQRIVITQPQLQQAQTQENVTRFSLGTQESRHRDQQGAEVEDEDQQGSQFEMLSAEQHQQALIEQLLQQKQADEQQLLQAGHFDSQSEEVKVERDGDDENHHQVSVEHLEDSKTAECLMRVQERTEGSHPNQVQGSEGRAREIPIMEYSENS